MKHDCDGLMRLDAANNCGSWEGAGKGAAWGEVGHNGSKVARAAFPSCRCFSL